MRDSADAKHTVFVEDLLGKQVQTADGHTLGRVFEVRLSSGPDYGVESLLLGSAGLANRFDLSRAVFYHLRLGRKTPQVVPWSVVDAFGQTLTLREGWQPQDDADNEAPPS